jgi:hypothetical protein
MKLLIIDSLFCLSLLSLTSKHQVMEVTEHVSEKRETDDAIRDPSRQVLSSMLHQAQSSASFYSHIW